MANDKDDELTSIIEGFKIFSSDDGDLINPNELKEIMEIMNMDEKNPFLYNIINNFCTDPQIHEKGGVDAECFISQLDQELEDDSSLGGIQKLFSVFYNPNTYTVPITTFSQASINTGDEENENILKNLISKSKLGDKEIDFNEFRDIMKGETPKKGKEKENENIVYKKKISSDKRESLHNHSKNNHSGSNNNNSINENINNKINKNNIVYDSMNSSDKNSEMYNFINKKPLIIYDNNKYDINNEIKYENNNSYDKNSFSNNVINNTSNGRQCDEEYNNYEKNDDMNNCDDINDCDNADVIYEKKVSIVEEIIDNKQKIKKDIKMVDINYDELNHISESNENSDYNDFEEQKDSKDSIINDFTKGRIDSEDKEDIQIETKEDNNNINNDNIKNEEKSEIKLNKRYHRRYREIKTNTPDKREKRTNDDYKNGKNSSNNSKYRRKK